MSRKFRKCVYIAGPIQNPNGIELFDNLRIGIQESVAVLKAGFSPFSPFIDFQFALNTHISIDEYYGYSLSQMVKQDAVYIIPNSFDIDGVIHSKGVLHELEVALHMDMIVCYSIDELIKRIKV